MERLQIKIRSPMTMIVSGQTGSGKTYWVSRLLQNQSEMIDPPFERIIFAHSIPQAIYYDMEQRIPNLELSLGLPDDLNLDGRNTALIIDDLMIETMNDNRLAAYFTKLRHQNLSTMFLVQNLYFRSQMATTITRNAQYLCLFPNLRDSGMIGTLGRQIFPKFKNFLTSAFEDASKTKYGYLFLDLRTDSDDQLRVRTNIFPGEEVIIYRPS